MQGILKGANQKPPQSSLLPSEKRQEQLRLWNQYNNKMAAVEKRRADEAKQELEKLRLQKQQEYEKLQAENPDNTELKPPSPVPSPEPNRKICFHNDAVFLAAAQAADTEEVERFLKNGQDINTRNSDGLTALHNACIDGNYRMTEFLVTRNADLDAKDNEGWTPLHAAAGSGHLRIANYLVGKGARVDAVNCDGDLAYDITEDRACIVLLDGALKRKGIRSDEDKEKARNIEYDLMIKDADDYENVEKN